MDTCGKTSRVEIWPCLNFVLTPTKPSTQKHHNWPIASSCCTVVDSLQDFLTPHMKFFPPCLLLSFGLHLATLSADGSLLLYLGFSGTNLSMDETATITPSGLLELTNGIVNRKGHAFYPAPLHFRKSHNGKVLLCLLCVWNPL